MDDNFLVNSEEIGDEKKHNQLLNAIAALDGQQSRKTNQRSVISKSISEFNFGATQESHGKVNLNELVHSLQDKALDKTVRKNIKNKKVVPVPIPRHEKEKIQRTVAYEKTTKEISKWDRIVNQNRLYDCFGAYDYLHGYPYIWYTHFFCGDFISALDNFQADQLVFPIEKSGVKVLTQGELVKTFKPRTPLEIQVAEMLGKSDHVIKNEDDDLTPAEKRALEAMDVEEAKERRKELMKHRHLLSYKEAKAKRLKKIKSKKHRRVARKHTLKKEGKMLAEMQKNDPEGFAEKMKMLDKQRIEERMSLKHRGGSKYIQRQKMFAKYDDQARQQVQNMLQFSRELTKKHEVDIDDKDEDEIGDGATLHIRESTEMDDMDTLDLNNPWMAKQKLRVKGSVESERGTMLSINSNNDKTKKESIDNVEVASPDEISLTLDIDETTSDIVESIEKHTKTGKKDEIEDIFKNLDTNKSKKNSKKKNKKGKNRNDDEINIQDKTSDSSQSKLRRNQSTENPYTPEEDEDISNNGIEEGLERKRTLEDFSDDSDVEMIPFKKVRQDGKKDLKPDKDKKSQEEAYIDPNKLMMIESNIQLTGEGLDIIDNDDNEEEDQRTMIAQAFADDDVVEEFVAEKSDDIEQKTVKDIDLTLPGWGEWGGESVKPKKKKNLLVKAPAQPERQDSKLGHVIINQEKSKNILKHQVSSIPFPYTSSQQFEASIKAPIGQTWNTPNSFSELTKPKVVTKMGSIITPLDKQNAFKKDSKKSSVKFVNDHAKTKDGKEPEKSKEKKGNKKHKTGGKRGKPIKK